MTRSTATRVSTLLACLLLSALLALPAFGAPQRPLVTELTMDAAFLDGSQNVVVHFSMTNVSAEPVRVLSWQTPFEGIEADLFQVARNGELVPYLGRVYKRPAPGPSDFLVMAPGETLSADVELSAYYEMSYTGEYVVNFRGESFDHTPMGRGIDKGARLEVLDMTSNEVVFWIDGAEPPVAGWQPAGLDLEKAKPVGGGGGKEACDNSQKAIIVDALAAAQGIAANASAYLAGAHNASSPRYNEWFGAYSSGRWETVDGNFVAISDALDNAPIEFDCKCKQPYYAYVYSNQPYKIYLCKYFWLAPLTGTDSKAGTLVHEMSHFDIVAGTDDVTYGQNSCRALADSDPNSAIRNADSHEYFAENTPFLN